MKTHIAIAIAIGIAASAPAADAPKTSAPPSTPAPAKGFDVFHLVKTRNIFDPERRAMVTASTAARPSAPAGRTNSLRLTGTMVAEGKTLAFFSGSRSEYSKVISIGDTIADFKIAAITNTQVELERAGKKITVAVGGPVPLEGTAGATAAEPAPDANSPTPPDGANPPADGPTADAPAPDASTPSETKPADGAADEKSEILRRMMERRQKELSK